MERANDADRLRLVHWWALRIRTDAGSRLRLDGGVRLGLGGKSLGIPAEDGWADLATGESPDGHAAACALAALFDAARSLSDLLGWPLETDIMDGR